ncbi:MAG: protein-L-isoaspartate(D-aspartate) O-methyltransferase [Candidatus Eisenbacteria bacterium]|nr:protein-L-isoaspartate(D-aspartate) O-methyltransferase [Candidatus Eisenbacteria bacterium]
MREQDFDALKKQMVELQLKSRGLSDCRVMEAMLRVPREKFVEESLVGRAYNDCALPIGLGQTISQPYMVALMTEVLSLKGEERVLEIGTGSGYQTAILAELSSWVYSVERISSLSQSSGKILRELGYTNITLRVGDGTLGWEEEAPFERIMITAGSPKVPPALEQQLGEGGRMVIPIGSSNSQVLELVEKKGGMVFSKPICGCTFVPLIGEGAWKEEINN